MSCECLGKVSRLGAKGTVKLDFYYFQFQSCHCSLGWENGGSSANFYPKALDFGLMSLRETTHLLGRVLALRCFYCLLLPAPSSEQRVQMAGPLIPSFTQYTHLKRRVKHLLSVRQCNLEANKILRKLQSSGKERNSKYNQ